MLNDSDVAEYVKAANEISDNLKDVSNQNLRDILMNAFESICDSIVKAKGDDWMVDNVNPPVE